MSDSVMGHAAVFTGERVECRTYPLVDPADDQVTIAVGLTGICGTDLHTLRSPSPAMLARVPMIPGHEVCGRVVSVGAHANDAILSDSPLRVGDRVIYAPVRSCGKCWWCRKFGANHGLVCTDTSGAARDSDRAPHFIGGWGDYVHLRPGTWVWKIPDSMPYEVAVLAEPFSTALRAVERGLSLPGWKNEQTLAFGGTVAVLGAGAIGLLTAAACRIGGAARVILIGSPASALEIARELDVATHTIDLDTMGADERIARVRELSDGGQGADMVFEAAGVPAAFLEGLDMVRRLGTMVELGNFVDTGSTVQLNVARQITQKDLALFASYSAPPHYMEKALRTLDATSARIDWSRLVTARFPVEQIDDALKTATNVQTRGIKVVLEGADARVAAIASRP